MGSKPRYARWARRYRPAIEQFETRATPAASFGFAVGLGSPLDDAANSVTTDSAGNVYVTGQFQGTIDFDPGAGTTSMTSAGDYDAFVAKYTSSGALVWARQMGGVQREAPQNIALDAAGNVYTIGIFSSSNGDFDPGAGVANLSARGSFDAFVSKLDSAGNYVWARSLSGGNNDQAFGLAVDSAGAVYVAGYSFSTDLDLDPGAGTDLHNSAGSTDGYLCKLDTNGLFVWGQQYGAASFDQVHDVTVDAAGNIFLTGHYSNTVDFDPGPGTFNLTANGNTDLFVSKLDSAGAFQWALGIGNSAGGDSGNEILTDAAGNVYVSGSFSNTVDFDPGAGVRTLAGGGFVLKLSTTGGFLWADGFSGGTFIALDSADNVFVTGSFLVTRDFDPGPGVFNLTSAGNFDSYVVKLDNGGNFVWASRFGGSGWDAGNDIAVDGSGQVYTVGWFASSPADFDPTAATVNLSTAGNNDAFLLQWIDNSTGATIAPTGASTDLAEGGASDAFTVVLNSVPTADVVITITPDAQTAAATTTITFTPANWNVNQTITLTAVNDSSAEGTHNGVISFASSSVDANFNNLTIPSLTATITDNETAGVTIAATGGSTTLAETGTTDTYTAVLTSQPTANVLVMLTPDAQVMASVSVLTFTTGNWNVAQTVTLTAVDDAGVEGVHSGIVTHTASSGDTTYNGVTVAALTASITDNDLPSGVSVVEAGGTTISEGGAGDGYTIALNNAPTANVIITLTASAQVTVAPTRLTFTPANWNTLQTVSVIAAEDSVAEGAHSAVISHTATSADANYNGVAISGVTASIVDNDTAGVALSAATFALTEGAGGNVYTVVLTTQPTVSVVVALDPGSQLTTSTPLLTFTAAGWNVPQTVTFSVFDDVVAEGAHSGTITHAVTSGDPAYSGVVVAAATVNISDNDVAGVLLSTTTMSLLEGGTRTYSVALSLPPVADVQVMPGAGVGLTVDTALLVFTPSNWNIPQTVIVRATDDAMSQGTHFAAIGHAVSSSDAGYSGLTVPDLDATIYDNEGITVEGTTRPDRVIVSNSADLGTVFVNLNGKTTSYPATISQLVINVSAGADDIQILNPIVPIVVIGGQDSDKVLVKGPKTAANITLTDTGVAVNSINIGLFDVEGLVVQGGVGDDTFSVQTTPAFATDLRGDQGNDVLRGGDRPNTWTINNPNAGKLNTTVAFSAIENLSGGSDRDGFFFAAGRKLTGAIDGGAGLNKLDYSAYTTAVAVNLERRTATGMLGFLNIGELVGSKSTADLLTGANQSNLWDVTDFNTGAVGGFSFRGIESLTGGQQDDIFRLADGRGLKGKIDGGMGSNTLDYSSYLSASVTLNLQSRLATNLGGFLNMQQLVGGSGKDTLIGANQTNIWNLARINGGDVGGLAFDGFENLTGGIKNDSFTLAVAGGWTGLVNGGTGIDDLSAAPGGVYVVTGTGAGLLNGRGFSGIEARR